MDEEILNQSLKKLYNKILKQCDFHNSRVNYDQIVYEIGTELKNKIKKKIESQIMSEIRNAYNYVLKMNNAAAAGKFVLPDDSVKLNNGLLNIKVLEEKLDRVFLFSRRKISSLNFEDEFSETLKNIYKNNLVSDYDLMRELRIIFENEQRNISFDASKYLHSLLETVSEECVIIINQFKKHIKQALEELSKSNEKVEEKDDFNKKIDAKITELEEEERKAKFIQAREEQRKKDSIEREQQLSARIEVTMADNNYNEELTSRRR